MQTKSLVCFLRKDAHGQWAPKRFGTVASRDSDLLADRCVIGISFLTDQDMADTVMELAERNTKDDTKLFIAASDFAFMPVLERLKTMTSIPFAEEIVHGRASPNVAYMSVDAITRCLSRDSKLMKKFQGFDASQNAAFWMALQQRMALIQGPPGKRISLRWLLETTHVFMCLFAPK